MSLTNGLLWTRLTSLAKKKSIQQCHRRLTNPFSRPSRALCRACWSREHVQQLGPMGGRDGIDQQPSRDAVRISNSRGSTERHACIDRRILDAKLQVWTVRTLVDAVVVVAVCRHAISPSRR